MATTRLEDRIFCSLGKGASADVQFEDSQALTGAGVLFLIPALLAQGLLNPNYAIEIFSTFKPRNPNA